MLFEIAIRRIIKLCEMILVCTVYLFYAISYLETAMKSHKLFMPIYLYLLTLSFYYYNVLLKKSPGSLKNYECLEIRSLCTKCNRLKNSRTFHCDSCNKCYYKRDHHCPWIGKCVAGNNYKEFYLFIGFMVLFLGLRLFRHSNYANIGFISNYIFIILSIFFVYINLLLCNDMTNVEYGKSLVKSNYFMQKNIWSMRQLKHLRSKIKETIFDEDYKNALYILLPVLKQRASVLDVDE